jgi:acetyl esterase/lipase
MYYATWLGSLNIDLMKRTVLIILILLFCACLYAQQGEDTRIEKKKFIYKTVGATSISADLYQATGNNGLQPVIVWIHGGALMFSSREDIPEEQMKLYVNAGYAVVAIDYRLAPETKLPGIVTDVADAIQWVRAYGRELLNVDSSRVFVVGHSAGAYLALLSGYHLQNPPKAIVSFYGYGSITRDWYNKPDSFALTKKIIAEQKAKELVRDSVITAMPVRERLDLYTYSRQQGLWPKLVTGRNPKSEAAWFARYNPAKNIDAKYPPTLLIHGLKDLDVPFQESVLLEQEFKKKGVRHQFIALGASGHLFDIFEGGLSNPSVNNTFQEVLTFLNNYR